MVVGSAQLTKRLPYIFISLLGKTLSYVSFAKDLGVYIDQYLNYGVHITKSASSCMRQLLQISRIKCLLDHEKTLLLLINSFGFSKLFYCSSVWGTHLNVYKNFGFINGVDSEATESGLALYDLY